MNKGKFLIFCRDFQLIWHRFKVPNGIQMEKIISLWKKQTGFKEIIYFDGFKKIIEGLSKAYYAPRDGVKKLKKPK